MAMNKKQKEKIIRGAGDLLKAFVRGSQQKKRQDRSGQVSGLPQQPSTKPGCGGCN